MNYGEDGKYDAAYTYGLERILVEDLDETRPESQDPLYYLYDGLGSTTYLVKPDGNTRDHYRYDEYGKPPGDSKLSPDGAINLNNTFGYTGEQWDEETNLLYLRARFYEPETGRFLSRDSYEGEPENPLSRHLYAYVENNPVNRVDPRGNDSYVFYGVPHGQGASYEGGFEEQSKTEELRLKRQFGTPVHRKAIKTEKEFQTFWNSMGKDVKGKSVKIEGVSLLFHSSPYTLNINYINDEYITTLSNGRTPSGQGAGLYVGILQKKSIEQLKLLACNSGHLDHIAGNLATTFLALNNIKRVYAYDGSMSYTNLFGHYIPRLAFSQHYFKSWTKEKTFLGIKYKRGPEGLLKYYKDIKGNIKWVAPESSEFTYLL